MTTATSGGQGLDPGHGPKKQEPESDVCKMVAAAKLLYDATSEALLVADPAQAPPQRLLIMVERRLADEHARSGRREPALAVLDKMLHLADDAQKSAGAARLSVLVPRAYDAAGSVHAILAQAPAAPPGQRRRDREDARNGYQRAVSAWQQLSRQPEFSTFNRKEMEAAVAALASVSQARP